MTAIIKAKHASSAALTTMGAVVIGLALASYLTNMPLEALLDWAKKMFGWGFVLLFSGLFVVGAVAAQKIGHGENTLYWYEVGQQSANGISTLALTFTLLGISLGISSLSEQTLSPETIQGIIQELTKQFSTAFMTTVVGLPAATVIRAWTGIRFRKFNNLEGLQQ